MMERPLTRGWGRAPLLAVLSGAAMLVAAAFVVQDAHAGITDTKHNLGSNGALGPNKTSRFDGTGEICVFCHTPHGADTTASAPLWNRALAGLGPYQTYDALGTSTLDGKTLGVGSVSIACLSCHDGTQAMNNVINQPGSGGYNIAGGLMPGSWTGTGVDPATGRMASGATRVANLGTDLRNDHPIGIQYCGGGRTVALGTGGTCSDADFRAPDFANGVFWVETGAAGSGRQKTDMILYNRAGTATDSTVLASQPFVECASCHDPHTSDNPTFLRISNTTPGSGVCLACHVK
jgi:predicted CXXCH cytochrome family protein